MKTNKQGGVTIEQVVHLWNNIVEMPKLSGNGYRTLIDIALNFGGHTTQRGFLETRGWKLSSIANTLKRLIENEFLLCKQIPKTSKMEYVINPMLFECNCEQETAKVDIDTFIRVWDIIRELTFMSSNTYRLFIDVLLFYEKVSPAEFLKKRAWKVSPTYASFKKLHENGLLRCEMEQGQTMYYINKEYFFEEE